VVVLPEKDSISFCFEPLRFLVRSPATREVSSRIRRVVYRRPIDDEELPMSVPNQAYFFQKAIVENEKEFESINVYMEFRKLITKGTKDVLKRLREKFEGVVPSSEVIDSFIPMELTEHYYIPHIARELPGGIYFHKTKRVAIIPINPLYMYLFGCDQKHISETIEMIVNKCQELNEVTSDFGLKLDGILASREYQKYLLGNLSNIESMEVGEPKNDFEKEIIQECKKFTSSFLPNVNIKFNDPVETFEYDIFLGFGEKSRVIIEPTDYESLKGEIQNSKFGTDTMKSRIILGTLDKARRLQAESIVVVKGFPKQKFLALKSLADSRGVSLMSDETYKNNLPSALLKILKKNLMRE
jgi:hypothetical protein